MLDTSWFQVLKNPYVNINSDSYLGLQGIDPKSLKEDKISFPKYDLDSRPSMQEPMDDFDEVTESISLEDAKDRLIDPENIVIGGKTSASMFEFVPSEDTINVKDGFVEESDYYTKYQELKQALPFDIVQAGVYDFPEKLDAFVQPYGVFDHFKAPRRPYVCT